MSTLCSCALYVFVFCICCYNSVIFLTLQKQDPAQFLQISGRSCKLHIDHNAIGPEPPNVM